MKQIVQRLSLAVIFLTSLSISALGIVIDGINYNLNSADLTAEVTKYADNKYVGEIIIPSTIIYESAIYNVTKIGNGAFWSCSELTSITIPNSVITISDYAFYNCRSLPSITIPNSVISIGEDAFNACYSLTSIIISNSLNSIERYTFVGCRSLSSLIIPNSVNSIGDNAFDDCVSLKEIYLEDGENELTVGRGPYRNESTQGLFYDCPIEKLYLGRTINDMSNNYYDYRSPFNKIISLSEVTIGSRVTSLPKRLFYGCSGISTLTIPASVLFIGEYAFSNCKSLADLIIEDSEKELLLEDYKQFEDCPLEKLYLGRYMRTEEVESWWGPEREWYQSPFRRKETLSSVTIGNKVTRLMYGLFEYCTGLTSVMIPESVTSIGNGAFRGCSGLTSVNIPENVTSIEADAFCGCSGLTSVNIPESVTSIGGGAFRGCSGLTSINIPKYVTNLDGVFSGCTNLSTIEIPECVTSLYGTFADCESLASVNIPENVTKLEETFHNCVSLSSITIPNNVTYIGLYAFCGCNSLTSITIPNSVSSTYANAFSDCQNLVSVTLGSGLVSIYDGGFTRCPKLEEIYCYAQKPPKCGDKNCFPTNRYNKIQLHVPKGTKDTYAKASVWSYFTNIIDDIETTEIADTFITKETGADEFVNVYNLKGVKLFEINADEIDSLPSGIYIIRYSDGSTTKVMNK